MHNEIHSYTDLQQQLHQDLRTQHPEWIEPGGDSPICDSYEQRLAELIGLFRSAERDRRAPTLCECNGDRIPNEGLSITSAAGTENPTHAPWQLFHRGASLRT